MFRTQGTYLQINLQEISSMSLIMVAAGSFLLEPTVTCFHSIYFPKPISHHEPPHPFHTQPMPSHSAHTQFLSATQIHSWSLNSPTTTTYRVPTLIPNQSWLNLNHTDHIYAIQTSSRGFQKGATSWLVYLLTLQIN